MVDAGAGFFGRRDDALANDARAAVPRSTVSSMTLAEYSDFASAAPCAPAQSAGWVTQWATHVEGEYAFVPVDGSAGARMALPLEIVRTGPFRVARFVSGTHANGNFPACLGGAARIAESELRRAVTAARPDVDVVYLERLATDQDGVPNPLLSLASQESPNIALAVSLDGGFDALLGRASGKRKRKKHRSQTRKFDAAGGHRRIEATTEEAVDALLDSFFVMKAERFRRMGIADVFAASGVQAAFRAIFKRALSDPARPFVLHGLEVGGRLRAVTGSSSCGGRLICEFGAIAEDDVSFASPGEFLFFENIREASESGYAIYDFSVGDEPYKRLWCDVETRHFDVLLPLNAKGRLFAGVLVARSQLKRLVKQNHYLWSAVKRLRRSAAAPAKVVDDEAE